MKGDREPPAKGRMGRITKSIVRESGVDDARRVMLPAETYEEAKKGEERAELTLLTMERLERAFDEESRVRIMERCGRQCFGPTHQKVRKALFHESSSLEEFLDKLNDLEGGKAHYRITEQGAIIIEYPSCRCGQVRESQKRFPNHTYCMCGVGFNKELFETVLGRKVDIILVTSAICDGGPCRFVVRL
ncbi:MAG: DUF6144 family protein [Methanomassiliicoccales archaeon]